jgi:peptidoglycan/xylan/chitin deacetylase (PgdA/CDA1 family)
MLTLLYHNVLTDPGDGLPVAAHQVTIQTFRRQIHRLRDRLVHPLEVHDQLRHGKKPRGVLITFDDGASGIEDAARVLAEVGTPGVAFICPGALTDGLWFYRLADSIVRATVPRLRWRQFDLSLAQVVEQCKAYATLSKELFDWSPSIRDEGLAEIEAAAELPDDVPHAALTTIDEAGVRRAAKTGGLFFANHSWSHPNLVKLSRAELTQEIEAAQCWLESSALPVIPWFAFPRGNHNAGVTRLVTQFCPVVFGASAREREPRVLPRTYIQEADSNPVRFGAKTAWEGRLRRYLIWR